MPVGSPIVPFLVLDVVALFLSSIFSISSASYFWCPVGSPVVPFLVLDVVGFFVSSLSSDSYSWCRRVTPLSRFWFWVLLGSSFFQFLHFLQFLLIFSLGCDEFPSCPVFGSGCCFVLHFFNFNCGFPSCPVFGSGFCWVLHFFDFFNCFWFLLLMAVGSPVVPFLVLDVVRFFISSISFDSYSWCRWVPQLSRFWFWMLLGPLFPQFLLILTLDAEGLSRFWLWMLLRPSFLHFFLNLTLGAGGFPRCPVFDSRCCWVFHFFHFINFCWFLLLMLVGSPVVPFLVLDVVGFFVSLIFSISSDSSGSYSWCRWVPQLSRFWFWVLLGSSFSQFLQFLQILTLDAGGVPSCPVVGSGCCWALPFFNFPNFFWFLLLMLVSFPAILFLFLDVYGSFISSISSESSHFYSWCRWVSRLSRFLFWMLLGSSCL